MRRELYIIYILIALFPGRVFSQEGALSPLAPATTADKPPLSALKTEVSGFFLQGKKFYEVLNIEDLETIAAPDGRRLLPLLRLLKILEIPAEEKEDALFFSPNPSTKIVLDCRQKTIQTNGKTRSVSLVVGLSDITMEKEVFLGQEVVGEILSMDIRWNNPMYRFQAKTDQKLAVWSQPQRASLLSVATQKVQSRLPSLLPPAAPRNFTLDFLELQAHPYYSMYSRSGSKDTLTLDSLMQSFWGNAFGGRYRLQFTEPYISWDGTHFQTGPNSSVMLNRGDWHYYTPQAEIAAGDSIFGLNDMTFPIIRMTGVRYSGMWGIPEDSDLWRPSSGWGTYFTPPHAFTGSAPTGSKVELIINERSIETQDVLIDTYRFDNIRLTPGALNVVRMVITEPSGYQRVVEQQVFGKNVHLPRGGFTFLSGLGTNRTVGDWSSRGVVGGGRAFYGLTDTLTLSATMAAQDNFYLPITDLMTSPLKLPLRDYPRSSYHMGSQAVWLPKEYFLLSGDIAVSRGSWDQDVRSGFAFKIKGDFYPSPASQVSSQFFHYGSDFFNGENLLLRDREGYVIDGKWKIHRHLGMGFAAGSVWNNLERHLSDTLRADFQNLEIYSNIVPRLTFSGMASRASFNWEDGGYKTLYTVKLQGSLFKDTSFDAAFTRGSYPSTAKAMDFFSGLRITSLSLYLPPRVAAFLYTPVAAGHTLGVSYWEDPNRKRPSFLYNYASQSRPIRIYNEIGYDMRDEKPYLNSRISYLFDLSGKSTLGLQTRYERGDWEISLLLSFTELFSYSRGKVTPISDSTVSPELAGVHGRVFIDANANGIMDPDEPGMDNIQVILDDIYKVATDKAGYFILPAQSRRRQCEVYINMETVPATYTPTHALQKAFLNPTGLIEVNLGIAPAHAITGQVQEMSPEGLIRPLPGIRVYLAKVDDGKELKDSVTGKDGSFYFGDLRPGRYFICVDEKTLSSRHAIQDSKETIEIFPQTEPQELKTSPFVVTLRSGDILSESKPALPAPRHEALPGPVAVPASSGPDTSAEPVLSSPDPVQTQGVLAEEECPAALVLLKPGGYGIIVEKEKRALHLFQYRDQRFMLVKSFPCGGGAAGDDGNAVGGLPSPLGVYLARSFIPGSKLPEKYGYGAFVLGDHNFRNRMARKDHTDIWLHGWTPEGKNDPSDLMDLRGIAVGNETLESLHEVLKISGTPIIVVNQIQMTTLTAQKGLAEELQRFMEGWIQSWESNRLEALMSRYSPEYINAEGMNYEAFMRQKERVNKEKKFIRIQIENPSVLMVREQDRPMAILQFTQRYSSSNFQDICNKRLYLIKGEAGWQIIGEANLET